MRRILFILFALPVTIFFTSWAVVFQKFRSSGDFSGHNWARILMFLSGVDLKVDLSAIPEGMEPVFMANHQSNFDILVTLAVLKDYPVRFVAKESLYRIPLFGHSMKAAGHISIDRSNRRAAMKSIDRAVDAAHDGFCPLVFPEGTRNPDPSRLMDFKIGGIIVALKCAKPVVPVIITGTAEAMPKGGLLPRPVTVRVKALEPIDASAYSLKEREKFKDDLYQAMNETYRELMILDGRLPANRHAGTEEGDALAPQAKEVSNG